MVAIFFCGSSFQEIANISGNHQKATITFFKYKKSNEIKQSKG
jgi:hypothetical protein